MTVRVAGDTIYVEGVGHVAEAEPILSALLEDPSRTIDLSGTTRLHSAVIQLLLALRPRTIGAPADSFQSSYLVALLDAGEG